MSYYNKKIEIPIGMNIPIRIIKEKPSQKGYLKRGLRIIQCLFLACLLIISQTHFFGAFEAHVINVTAEVVNDIPTIDPPGGQFCDDEEVIVELSVTLESADIYYTLNGFDPICYQEGIEYTESFELTQGTTVKARSCHNGQQSAIAIWYFDISPEYCPIDECLKINEVYYDPDTEHQGPPNEEKFEWIELYNSCDLTINLQNWYFRDDSGDAGEEIIHSVHSVGPYQYVIVAASAAVWNNYWNTIPENAVKIALGGNMMFNGLGNSQDYIKLYDSQGAEIDCVCWNDYGVFPNPGTNPCDFPDGWVPDVLEGHSIARKTAGVDTDAAFDWEDLIIPNPGSNPHSVGFDDDNFVELTPEEQLIPLTPEEGGPSIEERIAEIKEEVEEKIEQVLETASTTEEIIEEIIEEVIEEAITTQEILESSTGSESSTSSDSNTESSTSSDDNSEENEPVTDPDEEAKLEKAAILEEDSVAGDDLLDD